MPARANVTLGRFARFEAETCSIIERSAIDCGANLARTGVVAMRTSILIVDDSDVTRRVLATRLTEGGADVVCASSVKDALAVDATTITSAIVDVDLAGDDGISLADVLVDRNPHLRLALFTATSPSPEGHDEHTTFRKPDQIDHVIAWALEKS
jgi:CheY-like chemotaxis protein